MTTTDTYLTVSDKLFDLLVTSTESAADSAKAKRDARTLIRLESGFNVQTWRHVCPDYIECIGDYKGSEYVLSVERRGENDHDVSLEAIERHEDESIIQYEDRAEADQRSVAFYLDELFEESA